MNAILDAFRRLDEERCGRNITEAAIIGSNLRFRWQANGHLGVVVGEICIRDASDAEYAELEESIELGQVQIYTKPLYVTGQKVVHTVYHQATGKPIDENSHAARCQRERWARADLMRQIKVITPQGHLAKMSGFNLPLQVLRSANGFYLGTADENGPVSRESVEYWQSESAAAHALADKEGKTWTQRQRP